MKEKMQYFETDYQSDKDSHWTSITEQIPGFVRPQQIQTVEIGCNNGIAHFGS